MKIKFETNISKIRNKDVYEKALHIIEEETKQGFFRAKGESEFKLFRDDSLVKDAKFIELHIVKVFGKGEYKFNGNLSYNAATKEIKFYILSVVEFDDFRYDDVKMAEFLNEKGTEEEEITEIKAVIEKIEKNRPPYQPRQPRPGGRGGNRNGGGSRGGNNSGRSGSFGGNRNGSSNGGSRNGGSRGGSSNGGSRGGNNSGRSNGGSSNRGPRRDSNSN